MIIVVDGKILSVHPPLKPAKWKIRIRVSSCTAAAVEASIQTYVVKIKPLSLSLILFHHTRTQF